jgi:glycine/D-amino acid oxidase-like deaminating enzyme
MNSSAEAVVIGSGALGLSAAYHLARHGLRDVAVLDRVAIASQTSARGGIVQGAADRCGPRATGGAQ